MLQFLPVVEDNIIAVRASGKLSHEDYQQFLPELEKQITATEKVSILFELDNFHGWDLKAASDDFNFGMQHMDDFDRIAIVGDKAWEHWMVAMMKPFMPANSVQYFDRESLQQAWNWLREPMQLKRASKELKPFQNIAVAVDFSIYSTHAAKRAIELAKFYRTDLTLLHIAEEIVPYTYAYDDFAMPYPFDPELIAAQNQQQINAAKDRMDQFIESLSDNDSITLHSQVISGNINRTILSFIQAHQVDLMVFGGKKKTTVDKLLGSVPHYIQNHANCEVLISPLQEPAGFVG